MVVSVRHSTAPAEERDAGARNKVTCISVRSYSAAGSQNALLSLAEPQCGIPSIKDWDWDWDGWLVSPIACFA